jgi:hypothetical protein
MKGQSIHAAKAAIKIGWPGLSDVAIETFA